MTATLTESPPAATAPGETWDTRSLARAFVLLGLVGGRLLVRRKADGEVGTLAYRDGPRVYFGFRPDPNRRPS